MNLRAAEHSVNDIIDTTNTECESFSSLE